MCIENEDFSDVEKFIDVKINDCFVYKKLLNWLHHVGLKYGHYFMYLISSAKRLKPQDLR